MAKNKKSENTKGFDLKKLLKTIKLNESSISLVLGIIVIVIAGILISKNFSGKGSIPEELLNSNNSIESGGKIHKVEKNESLWQIAVNYYGDGYKWVDIATENKLNNASEIEIGQELVIPNLEGEQKEQNEITINEDLKPSNTSDSISENTYTVLKNDSLWKIAVRAYGDGYKWVEIAKENNISHPNLIHVGNVLKLPR